MTIYPFERSIHWLLNIIIYTSKAFYYYLIPELWYATTKIKKL